MELTRRFVFRGNASALGGQIFLPNKVIVDMDGGASALGVTGGISRSQVEARSFSDALSFESAMTFAQGLFDDEKLARLVAAHKRRQEELTTTTTVTAELRGLKASQEPLFTAQRIRGTLISRTPDGSGEPPIVPGKDTTIQGVDIGGYGLNVTLNLGLFQKYSTKSKLVAAADDPAFKRTYARHLSLHTGITGQAATRSGRIISSKGVIYATIVKEITWADKAYPKSSIDENSVYIPNLGRIFFGELLISESERRLTMVRFEFGSYLGGNADGGQVDTNGMWFP